ncbi:hypothetical protein TNCV_3146541 [Trichonephila clavipes]|nr:hypothetical protein TNCV_3146541 [Trichonephila clavipes]
MTRIFRRYIKKPLIQPESSMDTEHPPPPTRRNAIECNFLKKKDFRLRRTKLPNLTLARMNASKNPKHHGTLNRPRKGRRARKTGGAT